MSATLGCRYGFSDIFLCTGCTDQTGTAWDFGYSDGQESYFEAVEGWLKNIMTGKYRKMAGQNTGGHALALSVSLQIREMH